VSASRPRVTEFLIQFEHEGMIVRDQRHLIVRREKLEHFLDQKHPGASRTRSVAESALPNATVANPCTSRCILIPYDGFDHLRRKNCITDTAISTLCRRRLATRKL
jgi:hypothetical protein